MCMVLSSAFQSLEWGVEQERRGGKERGLLCITRNSFSLWMKGKKETREKCTWLLPPPTEHVIVTALNSRLSEERGQIASEETPETSLLAHYGWWRVCVCVCGGGCVSQCVCVLDGVCLCVCVG